MVNVGCGGRGGFEITPINGNCQADERHPTMDETGKVEVLT